MSSAPPIALVTRSQRVVLAHPNHPACRCRVERAMLDLFASQNHCGRLAPDAVALPGGSAVQLPGINPAGDLFVVPIVVGGPLGHEDLPAVARAVFTLRLATSVRRDTRAVLLFADDAALMSVESWCRRLIGGGPVELAVLRQTCSPAA